MSTRRLLARQERSPAGPAAGRALPGAVRARMETAFGADFSDVRVREDGATAELDAAAVTRGDEISFGPGMYDPHSPKGLEIIGHELAHVLQQRSGRVNGSGVTEVPALESEAHEAGRQAARGGPVTAPASADGGATSAVPATVAPGPQAGGPAQPGRVKDFFKRIFRRGNRAAAPGPAPAPTQQVTRPRADTDYANAPDLTQPVTRPRADTDYANAPMPQMTRQPRVAPPLRAPHTGPQLAANPDLLAEFQRRVKK